MSPRTQPLQPPFPKFAQDQFDRLMPPGVAPLNLFTTLAADERLFGRFMAGGLLDPGHLTLRQREIVIDRITARCSSEYEWGVHTSLFAERVGLTQLQIVSLVHGGADDPCWTADDERVLIRICDQLEQTCSLDADLWAKARAHLSVAAMTEVLMLCGFYRTVSYLTNGLDIALEPWAARFPQAPPR